MTMSSPSSTAAECGRIAAHRDVDQRDAALLVDHAATAMVEDGRRDDLRTAGVGDAGVRRPAGDAGWTSFGEQQARAIRSERRALDP